VIPVVTNATKFVIDNFTDNSDKPWMIMMHHKAPHRNQAAPAEFLGSVDNKTFSLPETFWDNYATKCPASGMAENKVKHLYYSNDLKLNIPDGKSDPGIGGGSSIGFNATNAYENFLARMTDEQKTAWLNYYSPISDAFYNKTQNGTVLEVDIYQRMMRDYIQTVKAVDDSVGKVLKHLEDKGILDNTLIVYTSDQGFFLGEHGFFDKRFMYEPTLHTPLLMRYPPMIKAGSV
jgi:uncharacterized sulfatase